MTFEQFVDFDKRMLETIGLTLDNVRLKSYSDFVLLLARGDYYEVLYTHTRESLTCLMLSNDAILTR